MVILRILRIQPNVLLNNRRAASFERRDEKSWGSGQIPDVPAHQWRGAKGRRRPRGRHRKAGGQTQDSDRRQQAGHQQARQAEGRARSRGFRQGWAAELCDKRWLGFDIEYLLMAIFFLIQYQNQYLYFLAIVTDTDINTAQWVIFESETSFIFSCLGP